MADNTLDFKISLDIAQAATNLNTFAQDMQALGGGRTAAAGQAVQQLLAGMEQAAQRTQTSGAQMGAAWTQAEAQIHTMSDQGRQAVQGLGTGVATTVVGIDDKFRMLGQSTHAVDQRLQTLGHATHTADQGLQALDRELTQTDTQAVKTKQAVEHLGNTVQHTGEQAEHARGGLSGFVSSLSGGLGNLAILTGAAVGVAAVGAGLGDAVGKAAAFEQQMSAVKATSGATDAELAALRHTALDLGQATDVGSVSASDAARAIFELGKAGVSVTDINTGAAKATLQLAAAAGPDFGVANSAALAADSLNTFGLAGKDATTVANVLVGAANASSIGLNDLKFSLGAVGPVAAQMGVSMRDFNVTMAEFGMHGLKGADAGTSLKTMLLNLTPATKGAYSTMKDLGLITKTGSDLFFDQSGKVKDLATVQQILQDHLKGLNAEQQSTALKTMFGTDAIRAAAIMAGGGAAEFNKFSDAVTKQGNAAMAAATMSDNLKGKWEALQGTIDTIEITIASALLPALSGIVDAGNRLLSSPGVTAFFANVAAAIPGVLTALGTVGSAIGIFVGLIGQAVGLLGGTLDPVFMAIQTGAQAILTPLDELNTHIQALGQTVQTGGLANLGAIFQEALPGILTSLQQIGIGIVEATVHWEMALWQWIDNALPGVVTALASFGSTVFTWITGTGIPRAVDALFGMAQAFMDWVLPAVPGVLAQLAAWGTGLLSWLLNTAIPTAWNLLLLLGRKFVEWVAPNVGPMLLALGQIDLAVLNFIGSALVLIADKLTTWGGALIQWIWDALPHIGPALATVGQFIINWVNQAGPILQAGFQNFGIGLINGLIDGINNAVKGLFTAIAGVANGIITILNSTGLVHLKPIVMGAFEEIKHILPVEVGDLGKIIIKGFNDLPAQAAPGLTALTTTTRDHLRNLDDTSTTALTHVGQAAKEVGTAATTMGTQVQTGATTADTGLGNLAKHAAGHGAKVAKTFEDLAKAVIGGMSQALGAVQTGGAGVATAIQDMLAVLPQATDAHMGEFVSKLTTWMQAAAHGTAPQAQAIYDQVLTWLTKLAHDGNVQVAIYAQAALEHLQNLADKAGVQAEKLAAKLDSATLKAQQSVIGNLGKMAEDAGKTTTTLADEMVVAFDILQQNGTAKFAGLTTNVQALLDQMGSAIPPTMQQIQDAVLGPLQQIATNGTGYLRALAQAALDHFQQMARAAEIQSAKMVAKLDSATLQAQQSVISNLGKMADSAGKKTTTMADEMVLVFDLLKQNGTAKFAGLTDALQQLLDQMQSSTPPTMQQIQDTVVGALQQMATQGTGYLQALAQAALDQFQQVQDAADKAAAAAQRAFLTGENSLVGSLQKTVLAIVQPGANFAGVLLDLLTLSDQATAAHMPQIAGQIIQWFQAAQAGSAPSARAIRDQLIAWLTNMAASSDPILAGWATNTIRSIKETATQAGQTAFDAYAKTFLDPKNAVFLQTEAEQMGMASGEGVALGLSASLTFITPAMQQMQEAVVGPLTGVLTTIQNGTATTTGVLIQLWDLAGVATKAGMGDMAQTITAMIAQVQAGTMSMSDVLAAMNGWLDQLDRTGDTKTKLFVQQYREQIGLLPGITAQAGAGTLAVTQSLADRVQKMIATLQAGYDFMQKLGSGDLRTPGASAINAFLDSFDQVLAAASAHAEGWKDKVTPIVARTADAAEKLVGGLGGAVDTLTKLVNFVAPSDAAVTAFFGALDDFLTRFADRARAWATDATKETADLAGYVGQILGGIGAAIDPLAKMVNIKVPSAHEVDVFFGALGVLVTTFADRSRKWADSMSKEVAQLATNVGTVMGGLSAAVDTLSKIADLGKKDAITPALIDFIIGNLSLLLQKTRDLAGVLSGGDMGKVVTLAHQLAAVFGDLRGVLDNLKSLQDAAGNIDAGKIAGVLTALGEAVHQIAGTATGALTADLPNISAQAQSVGAAIDDGIIHGITAGIPAIEAAAAAAVDHAIAAAKAAGEIGSPSRRAGREIGIPIGQGVIGGLFSTFGALGAAGRAMITAVLGGGSSSVRSAVGTAAVASREALHVHVYVPDRYGQWQEASQGLGYYQRVTGATA